MNNIILPEQIIWSADTTREKARAILESEALPEGTGVKVDRLFLLKYGMDAIDEFQALGYLVFADTKIAEIPSKSLAIAKCYLARKPWMLNVMAGICSTGNIEDDNPDKVDALKRFADLCAKAGTKSCGVTVLTSKTPEMVGMEFDEDPIGQVLFYADLMADCGMTDIVCSAAEAEALRGNEKLNDLAINTPGIRLPGSSANDQSRVMTPARAFAAGADRLVIGRDLTRGTEDVTDEVQLAEIISQNYDRIIENINDNEI